MKIRWTPTSVVLRRLRRIVEGEVAGQVLTAEGLPIGSIGLINLRYSYTLTAEHLIDLLGEDGAVRHLNTEIAKACFRESGMARAQ